MAEKNTVKIVCNPYTQRIEYYRWDSEKEEWCQLNSYASPFSKPEFINVALQHKAYEILKHMNELYNPGNVGLDILFEGTKEDMEYLSLITNKHYSSCNINIIPGDMYLLSAVEVKKQIEDIFRSMKTMFSEYPNNEVTESINKFSETVRPTIPICVMGLYSAGKSAFINSLIGIELLPSASNPTTAKTYKISFGTRYEIKFTYTDKKKGKKEVVLSFDNKKYRVNQSAELGIVKELDEIMKYDSVEERMYYALSIINNYDMNYNRNHDDTQKLWRVSDLIEVTLPIRSSVLPFDECDFIIYDTPGSNSASYTDHTEVLKKAMEGQTNGLPIFVTIPDNMDVEDNGKLIKAIEDLGDALDKSNLMIVVNKADQLDFSELKEKKNNFRNLIVSNLNPAGIYFVSSIIGLGAKKMIFGNTTKNKSGKIIPKWIYGNYKKTFDDNLRHYDGTDDEEEFVSLYTYNIIDQNQLNNYTDNALSADNSASNEEVVYHNSGLHAIETAIRDFAFKYAQYNKCRNASGYLSDALKKLENMLTQFSAEQMELLNQLESSMPEQKKSVLAQLTEESEKMKTDFMGGFSTELSGVLEKKYDSNTYCKKITELWEDTEGKRGCKKQITKSIKELLHDEVVNYSRELKKFSLSFWENKQKEFKHKLISIIIDSPNLTREQQDLLKEAIMKIDVKLKIKYKFSIQKDDIVKGLFIKKLREQEATEKFMEKFKSVCINVNRALTDTSDKAFDQMMEEVKSQFVSLVAEYNPKVITLRNRQKECKDKLDYMKKQQTQIQLCLSEVEKLTVFKMAEVDRGIL